MNRNLSMSKVLDAHNIKVIEGVEYVDPAGVLRLMAVSAYHNEAGDGRRKSEIGLSRILLAAEAKGFVKSELLRSAFAEAYPPSVQAKELADEVAGLLGKHFFEALSD
jgi:hypothetical protein